MKLRHKILWVVAGIIPFGLWGIAFMCADFTCAFNLITISNCWLMLYSIAQLIILFMRGKRKYGIKKTFLASCAVFAGLFCLYLLLFLILRLCGVIQ